VLRETVDPVRERPPIRAGDVLFGMLLGTVPMWRAVVSWLADLACRPDNRSAITVSGTSPVVGARMVTRTHGN
jgi:hypothetical protein